MAFDPITSPVDYVIIAGQRSPGLATISGAGSPRQWDERRGYAYSGATVIYRGNKLAHFEIRFVLTTSEEFAAWADFSQLLKKGPSMTRPRALQIEHPQLADLEIRSVVVEDLLQPEQTGDGEWTVVCKFIEYRRPRPALARPDGAANGEPFDPLQARIGVLSSIDQAESHAR